MLTDHSGIDTVISALGRLAIAAQIPLVYLAAASPSVRWFLPSEYGTDVAYGPSSAHEKPHQQKLAVRAALEEVAERGDLAYTYVVTGPYPEMYMRGFPCGREGGGWDVVGRRATLLGERGEGRVSFTAMKE